MAKKKDIKKEVVRKVSKYDQIFEMDSSSNEQKNMVKDVVQKTVKRIPQELKKTCITCHTDFIAKRKDTKYCGDTCKNRYNNNKDPLPPIIKRTNKSLLKNYQILRKMLSKNISIVKIEDLKEQGFITSLMTTQYDDERYKEPILAIYDYAITRISNTELKILKLKL